VFVRDYLCPFLRDLHYKTKDGFPGSENRWYVVSSLPTETDRNPWTFLDFFDNEPYTICLFRIREQSTRTLTAITQMARTQEANETFYRNLRSFSMKDEAAQNNAREIRTLVKKVHNLIHAKREISTGISRAEGLFSTLEFERRYFSEFDDFVVDATDAKDKNIDPVFMKKEHRISLGAYLYSTRDPRLSLKETQKLSLLDISTQATATFDDMKEVQDSDITEAELKEFYERSMNSATFEFLQRTPVFDKFILAQTILIMSSVGALLNMGLLRSELRQFEFDTNLAVCTMIACKFHEEAFVVKETSIAFMRMLCITACLGEDIDETNFRSVVYGHGESQTDPIFMFKSDIDIKDYRKITYRTGGKFGKNGTSVTVDNLRDTMKLLKMKEIEFMKCCDFGFLKVSKNDESQRPDLFLLRVLEQQERYRPVMERGECWNANLLIFTNRVPQQKARPNQHDVLYGPELNGRNMSSQSQRRWILPFSKSDNSENWDAVYKECNNDIKLLDYFGELKDEASGYFSNTLKEVKIQKDLDFATLMRPVADDIKKISSMDLQSFFETMSSNTKFMALFHHVLGNVLTMLTLFSQRDWHVNANIRLDKFRAAFKYDPFEVWENDAKREWLNDPLKSINIEDKFARDISDNEELLFLQPSLLFMLKELMVVLLFREKKHLENQYGIRDINYRFQELAIGLSFNIFVGRTFKFDYHMKGKYRNQVEKTFLSNFSSVYHIKGNYRKQAEKTFWKMVNENVRMVPFSLGCSSTDFEVKCNEETLVFYGEEAYFRDIYFKPTAVQFLGNDKWLKVMGDSSIIKYAVTTTKYSTKHTHEQIQNLQSLFERCCIYTEILKLQSCKLPDLEFNLDPVRVSLSFQVKNALFDKEGKCDITLHLKNMLTKWNIFEFLDANTGGKRKTLQKTLRTCRYVSVFTDREYEHCCISFLFWLMGKGCFFYVDPTFLCYLAIFLASRNFLKGECSKHNPTCTCRFYTDTDGDENYEEDPCCPMNECSKFFYDKKEEAASEAQSKIMHTLKAMGDTFINSHKDFPKKYVFGT
jgi:hypothetical protein